MKKRVLTFVFVALLALATVPMLNIIHPVRIQGQDDQKWWSKSSLYNVDFALTYLGRLLYPMGMTAHSIQVVIGKQGWLFAGDQYQKTITVGRRGSTPADEAIAKKVGLATSAWNQWLRPKGVRLLQLMVCANKGTIYPEFMPDWAQPYSRVSATDALFANVDKTLYVDSRSELLAAKSQFSEPLYYRTDTHWNRIGAWVAFRTFTAALARKEPGLRLLTDKQIRITGHSTTPGMELMDFLRMPEELSDNEVHVEILSDRPIETERYDFDTGRLKESGGNPQLDAPSHPLLVKSKNALNHKRVLWLRDSFGTAMEPYMAATFSETLQIHYKWVTPEMFARLVNSYKPDYVFITVVERAARKPWFTNLPPADDLPSASPKDEKRDPAREQPGASD